MYIYHVSVLLLPVIFGHSEKSKVLIVYKNEFYFSKNCIFSNIIVRHTMYKHIDSYLELSFDF